MPGTQLVVCKSTRPFRGEALAHETTFVCDDTLSHVSHASCVKRQSLALPLGAAVK